MSCSDSEFNLDLFDSESELECGDKSKTPKEVQAMKKSIKMVKKHKDKECWYLTGDKFLKKNPNVKFVKIIPYFEESRGYNYTESQINIINTEFTVSDDSGLYFTTSIHFHNYLSLYTTSNTKIVEIEILPDGKYYEVVAGKYKADKIKFGKYQFLDNYISNNFESLKKIKEIKKYIVDQCMIDIIINNLSSFNDNQLRVCFKNSIKKNINYNLTLQLIKNIKEHTPSYIANVIMFYAKNNCTDDIKLFLKNDSINLKKLNLHRLILKIISNNNLELLNIFSKYINKLHILYNDNIIMHTLFTNKNHDIIKYVFTTFYITFSDLHSYNNDIINIIYADKDLLQFMLDSNLISIDDININKCIDFIDIIFSEDKAKEYITNNVNNITLSLCKDNNLDALQSCISKYELNIINKDELFKIACDNKNYKMAKYILSL